MKNALGLAALAAIGVAVGAYIKREHFSAEIMELPFRDVAVHNMQLRQDANIELNHLYGGVPDPTPINIIRLITGTPSYESYDPGVTL